MKLGFSTSFSSIRHLHLFCYLSFLTVTVTMYSYVLKGLIIAAGVAWAAQLQAGYQQQEGYLGFNSGARFPNYKAKEQVDFEKEFQTARRLRGSPGKFT